MVYCVGSVSYRKQKIKDNHGNASSFNIYHRSTPLWLLPDFVWNSELLSWCDLQQGTWLWQSNASFVVILLNSHPVHGFSISRELNSLLHLLSNEKQEALDHFFVVYLTTFTGVEL